MISLKKQTDPNEHEQLISFIFNDSMTFTALKAHFVEIPHSHLTPTPSHLTALLPSPLPGCCSACWVPTGSRQMWSFHRAPHRLTRPTTPGPATMESATGTSLEALNFSSVYASIHQGPVRWRAGGTAQCSALYHMWYTWAPMCAEQCQWYHMPRATC